jgi:hypothetical protein
MRKERMIHLAKIAAGFLTILLCIWSTCSATDTPADSAQTAKITCLPQGARIAILGDSITAGHLYSRVIETYLVACAGRKDLSFYTYGWSGATVKIVSDTMTRDISFFKPSLVTMAFGMNDGFYRPFNDYTRDVYIRDLRRSLQSLRDQGVQTIVVASPGAVDSKFFTPQKCPALDVSRYQGSSNYSEIYNSTLGVLADLGRSVAAEFRSPFVDLHTPLMETMKLAKSSLGDDYDVCGVDGYHPRANGGLIMAYTFLKALGCDGKIGEITIDLDGKAEASAGHVICRSVAGKVEIASSRYPFCFDQDPKSPTSMRSILPFMQFNQELNNLTLRVKNLDTQSARVVWGEEVREFSRSDLEAGVNLAGEFSRTPFDSEFQRFLSAVKSKQDVENLTIMKYSSRYLFDTEELEKDTEMKSSLTQLRISLMQYHDRMGRKIYLALPIIKHTVEVQPIR